MKNQTWLELTIERFKKMNVLEQNIAILYVISSRLAFFLIREAQIDMEKV